MNIFIKHCNGQNGHFTRFWHQHVASRIYALLSVIRQQMSPFDRLGGGGGAQSGQCPLFFYRFSYTTASLNWRGERKTSEERVEVWLQLSPIEQCVDCVMQGFAPFVSSSHHVQKVDIFKTVFGSIQTQEKSMTNKNSGKVWGRSAGWIFWVFSDNKGGTLSEPIHPRLHRAISSPSPASLTFILYAFLLMWHQFSSSRCRCICMKHLMNCECCPVSLLLVR